MLAPFEPSKRSAMRGAEGGGTSLPVEVRQLELERVTRLAEAEGLRARICGCKNGEITGGKCHLTNLSVTARASAAQEQPEFW